MSKYHFRINANMQQFKTGKLYLVVEYVLNLTTALFFCMTPKKKKNEIACNS